MMEILPKGHNRLVNIMQTELELQHTRDLEVLVKKILIRVPDEFKDKIDLDNIYAVMAEDSYSIVLSNILHYLVSHGDIDKFILKKPYLAKHAIKKSYLPFFYEKLKPSTLHILKLLE